MEPIQFLKSHPPFDRLDPEMLSAVEDALEVVFVTGGTQVLERGGPRSRWLFVVRKGAVRLERDGQVVDALEEGECFGFPSLIGRVAPHVDVVASEDAILYRIPEDAFARCMERPAFAEFFLLDLSERLRKASAVGPFPSGRELGAPCSNVAIRAPISVSPDATVREAARVMSDASIGSLLVEGDPQGIVTVRDLSRRVLAEGLGPETRVGDVMTRPVKTLAAEASLFEALLFMLENRVHHAPLASRGRIVGMLSDTDLLKVQGRNPFHVLDGMDEPARLAGYADELAELVASMAAGGLDAVRIGRMVSRLNDALVGRLLRRAETELGPPPCDYAWMVFGSEGRMEQALITDQDNALVYADPTPEASAYFTALAQRGVDGLLSTSFPPCRGGFMATRWCRPLSGWVELFRGWIETPEPKALVEASNFFDFRRVCGTLDLDPLDDVLRRASQEKLFLAHLAKCAVGFEPPLGLFRHIREEDGGVELKKGGIMPIVSLARLYALEAGSEARPTLERLESAARAGTLSAEGAATLAEAFRFLLALRLRDQLRARQEGRPPDNKARLESLSPLERRHLKDIFVAIRDIQEATALRYALNRLG